jgi:hypothetical protein
LNNVDLYVKLSLSHGVDMMESSRLFRYNSLLAEYRSLLVQPKTKGCNYTGGNSLEITLGDDYTAGGSLELYLDNGVNNPADITPTTGFKMLSYWSSITIDSDTSIGSASTLQLAQSFLRISFRHLQQPQLRPQDCRFVPISQIMVNSVFKKSPDSLVAVDKYIVYFRYATLFPEAPQSLGKREMITWNESIVSASL